MISLTSNNLFEDYAASKTIVQIGFWTAVNEANQFCQDVSCPIAAGNVTIHKVTETCVLLLHKPRL
jgi:hypothetical protein